MDHDLETTPLQIITDKKPLSEARPYVKLDTYRMIAMKIDSRQFQVCSKIQFPSDLVMRSYQIWTISRTNEALTILCNGEEALNMVYAEIDKYCTRIWSKSSTTISFWRTDVASDYMRSLRPGRRIY